MRHIGIVAPCVSIFSQKGVSAVCSVHFFSRELKKYLQSHLGRGSLVSELKSATDLGWMAQYSELVKTEEIGLYW